MLPHRPPRNVALMNDAAATMEIWPGKAYPLGATYDGSGTNFAVFSEAAERVELCLFDQRHRDQGDAARGRRIRLARLHPEHRAGPTLRLSGARPLRPPGRSTLQPQQIAAGPLRQGHRRHLRVEPVAVRLQLRRSRQPQRRRLGGQHAQVGRHQPVLRLGRGPAAWPRVRRHRHLRGACQGADADAPRNSRTDPRHLRRRRSPGHHRTLEVVGRQCNRADAGAPLRQRLDAHREGVEQLLGLQHHRLPRARSQVQQQRHAGRPGPGVQGHGPCAARGRHRSDPRRRLQPHRGGQPPRADAVHARDRQRRVLPRWSRTTSATTWTTPAPATASTSAIRTACS